MVKSFLEHFIHLKNPIRVSDLVTYDITLNLNVLFTSADGKKVSIALFAIFSPTQSQNLFDFSSSLWESWGGGPQPAHTPCPMLSIGILQSQEIMVTCSE